MIETLKFSPQLIPLILSGEKSSTWRLWDDKDLKEGDRVILIARPELSSFAKAVITSVVEKPMGQLTDEDKKGHEKFDSDSQMYATYSKYYGRDVRADTLVKIVRFKLEE